MLNLNRIAMTTTSLFKLKNLNLALLVQDIKRSDQCIFKLMFDQLAIETMGENTLTKQQLRMRAGKQLLHTII